MITTILFDLDGTLLPMDQEAFAKAYFSGISQKAAPRGYEPAELIRTIWAGTAKMAANTGRDADGTPLSNEAVFWRHFAAVYGEEALRDTDVFDAYYEEDFDKIRSVCGFQPEAAPLVHALRARGLRVVLATNPIFPRAATARRIRWAGLAPEDFALCTTYEASLHSKPNPDYYCDILRELGVPAEECVMVGNDVAEDMVAEALGMRVFLLTDCLINKAGADISRYPHGDFEALKAYLNALLSGQEHPLS